MTTIQNITVNNKLLILRESQLLAASRVLHWLQGTMLYVIM